MIPITEGIDPKCLHCAYRFNGCDGYSPEVDCHEGHRVFYNLPIGEGIKIKEEGEI